MSRQIPISDHCWPLLNAACDGDLADVQIQELATLLDSDPTVRKVFIHHVQLRTDIQFVCRAEHACDGGLARVQATLPRALPTVFPAPFHGTFGFFPEGLPLAYLVATVVTGLGILLASHVYMSRPEQVARAPYAGRSTAACT